jgi:hypothetical protein
LSSKTYEVFAGFFVIALTVLLIGCGPAADAPSLVYPGEADTLSGSQVTFSWSAVESATLYRIEIASDSFFMNPAISADTLASTSYLVDFSFGGPLEGQRFYYWHAAAYVEGWSAWSETRSFYNANVNPPGK